MIDDIIKLKIDILDIIILRKFYNELQPNCFPILYNELRNVLPIGYEGLRKRLDKWVRLGFLLKISRSNPANYNPIEEKKEYVDHIFEGFKGLINTYIPTPKMC